MNKPLLLAGVLALALSPVVSAQEQQTQAPAAEIHSPEASDYDLRVTDLLGKEVRNARNEDIADVEDLVVTPDGQVLAILSVGGLLGLGEELVAVPYRQLQPGPADEDFVFYPGTEEQLEALPEFVFREGTAIWNIDGDTTANTAEMTPAPGEAMTPEQATAPAPAPDATTAPAAAPQPEVESPAEAQAPAEPEPVETNE